MFNWLWVFNLGFLSITLCIYLFIFFQINNGMAHLEALLEPLLDLCSLENVKIQ